MLLSKHQLIVYVGLVDPFDVFVPVVIFVFPFLAVVEGVGLPTCFFVVVHGVDVDQQHELDPLLSACQYIRVRRNQFSQAEQLVQD